MLTRPIRNRRGIGRTAAATLVAFTLVAAACGGDDDDDAVSTDTEAPSDDTDGADDTDPPATDGGDDGDDGGDDGDEPAETTAPPAPVVTEPPASEAEPTYGGSLVVGIEADTGSPWRPANMSCASSCQFVSRTFYDALVAVNDQLDWEPYLATSVEANEDDTVFTITLREGVEFHDGTPFDADAAMFNLNTAFTGLLISGAVKDIAKNPDGSILMEKIDDYTFTLQTGFDGDPANPISWPLFPYYLGGQGALMASPTWLQAVDAGEASETAAVGTGPFQLVSYAPGDRTNVERNPNYWLSDENGNQLPYLDAIEFRVIEDSQVRGEALRSGDLDMMATSDSLVVADFSEDPNFETVNQDQYSETNYIMFNLTKPYLADRDVRCALLQAIDTEDLIEVVSGGAATPSIGPFTPGQEGFLTDNGYLGYDPDAAADAIAAYTAENGPITINYSTTPTVTNLQTAQYLAGEWGAIGVNVVIDQIEQSTLINNALFADEAFDAFGWRNHAGIFVDSQYFWWHGSSILDSGLSLNFGRLDDPVINDLLEQQRTEYDEDVRRGIAEDINRRFAEQCFILPTSQTEWGIHYRPEVQNIGRTPFPDGSGFLRDGAGFPGQVWMTAVFLAE